MMEPSTMRDLNGRVVMIHATHVSATMEMLCVLLLPWLALDLIVLIQSKGQRNAASSIVKVIIVNASPANCGLDFIRFN